MAYTIEEEQELNEIKTWWKENYKVVIGSVVLAIAGVSGWNFWKSYQVEQVQQTSAQYEQVLAQEGDLAKNAPAFQEFVKAHEKTSYAVFALLEQAKLAVEGKDFVQAESLLKQAQAQSNDEVLSAVTTLRLASVQLELKQFDVALATLNSVQGESWNSTKLLLTGDIQAAKGDKAAAKASYEQAQKNASASEQEWIQIRLNNL